jgi:hypothetical protein
MLFGATFKGSKWVDYQTFNINKLFIKSGLSYFYYIIFATSSLFLLLGRSKSEQYFGFFPFFTYLNFLLGYIPLLLGDLSSQVILIVYTLYTLITTLLYKLINRVGYNALESTNQHYINKHPNQYISTDSSKNFTKLFNKDTKITNQLNIPIPLFSKMLSTLSGSLGLSSCNSTFDNNVKLSSVNQLTTNFKYLTIKSRTNPKQNCLSNSLTDNESYYIRTLGSLNYKTHNQKITLNKLNKTLSINNYPRFFNFNIENNLSVSKQQRWLSKNSILSESIIPNSFLITQSKKLIGSGVFDNDFTNKTL